VTVEGNLLTLTQDLVRIQGLSGNESRVADRVEAAMRELGYRDIGRDALGNVVGFVGPKGTATALLFDSHMDVVPVMGTWSHDPFGAEIVDGRLYGRGATDMKGPLAASLCGVADAARSGCLSRPVAVSASVLEETIEGLALAAVLDRTRPEAVVICEPSSLAIKHGQRGRIEIMVDVFGIPAHAAHPEQGRNPILLAAEALRAIDAMPLPSDPHLGRAIIVPTDIVTNPYPSISSIPPELTMRFDRRTVVGETCEEALDALRGCLTAIDRDAFRVRVSNSPVSAYTGQALSGERLLAAWLDERTSPLMRAVAASLSDCGCQVSYGVYAFCTNGSESAGRRGIPTVGLGPGAEADAHTIDESISIAELEAARRIYRSLTLRLAGGMT
jgi:putative selenium metabolism hydrolase